MLMMVFQKVPMSFHQQLKKRQMHYYLLQDLKLVLAVEAQKELTSEGIDVSVISMPSWDRFEVQSKEYKETVFRKM